MIEDLRPIMQMPGLMIGITLKRGDKILKRWQEEGHSWTRNAWNWMSACMMDLITCGTNSFGAGIMTSKNVSGTVYRTANVTGNRNSNAFSGAGFSGPAGNDTTGIIVGTGDAAYSFEDFKLDSQIPHGAGAGNLEYYVVARTQGYSDKKWTQTFERTFFNNSPVDITIKEVGLAYRAQLFSGSTVATLLLARDVLTTAAQVPAGVSAVIEYALTMDYGSVD